MIDNEADMVRDTAQRIFGAHCDRQVLAAAARGQWPTALWDAVEASGLPLALVGESGGGAALPASIGLSLVGLAAEYAAPIPLAETMIAAWLLDRSALAVPPGPLTFATIVGQTESEGGAWCVSGIAARVPWGRAAHVVGIADSAAGPRLFLLGPRDFTVEPGINLAGEPRDTLTISAIVDGARTSPAPVASDELRAIGAALRAMQISGALKRASELSVRYAQERVQFGRPLSQFQAIQQNLAVLATQAAVSEMAATMARQAVIDGTLLPNAAIAKARTSEAAGIGAGIAHQVHGAIGFTLEHDLQFSTKRLYAWRDEFGNETEWNLMYGRRLSALGPDRLWAAITAAD